MAQFAHHFVFAQLLQRALPQQAGTTQESTGQNALVNKSHRFAKLTTHRILRYAQNCVKRRRLTVPKRQLVSCPNRKTAPFCGTSRSAHQAVPGRADSSAPPVGGPALHPETAPPLHGRSVPALPPPPRFRPQFPALSNRSP